ncbi:unnamed protein product, partial [Ectocarpus sp. 6 AP-2014]
FAEQRATLGPSTARPIGFCGACPAPPHAAATAVATAFVSSGALPSAKTTVRVATRHSILKPEIKTVPEKQTEGYQKRFPNYPTQPCSCAYPQTKDLAQLYPFT